MKRLALIGVCVAALSAGIMGCNWETGNDAASWSSSYNWVNFSGVYRSASGGLLVTDYTTTPSAPGSTNVLAVSGEAQGSFTVYQTAFSGKLKNGNVVPGSAAITLYNKSGTAILTIADNGNRVLTSGTQNGTIDYVSGSWSITFSAGMGPAEAGYIRASYSYYVSNDGTAGSGAVAGSTGKSIYSFSVTHQGQNLTFVDNNGCTYAGKISQIRSLSGAENTDIEQVSGDEQSQKSLSKITYYESDLPADGDAIVANFEVSGVSAAMMQVTIVGTFEGTVASGVFTGRLLKGTWIELGGKTGDINGQTTSVTISTAGTSTGTTTDTNTTTTAAAMAIAP